MIVLFIGDIVGRPGRKIVREQLPLLKKEYSIDVVIANGENAAGGFGITGKIFDEIISAGVDIVTSGNHIWDKKEIYNIIDQQQRLLRPLNYPPKAPGRGYNIYPLQKGENIAVMNLLGRAFMGNVDCPFRTFSENIDNIRKITKYIIVDFHAEATAEKKAFLFHADGKVSAVLGTHTHIQTNDALITEKGTLYMTDAGMSGVHNSVIGMEAKGVLKSFLTGLPQRFTVATGEARINGILMEIDKEGKATEFKVLC